MFQYLRYFKLVSGQLELYGYYVTTYFLVGELTEFLLHPPPNIGSGSAVE
jgi:hypothetical protein